LLVDNIYIYRLCMHLYLIYKIVCTTCIFNLIIFNILNILLIEVGNIETYICLIYTYLNISLQ